MGTKLASAGRGLCSDLRDLLRAGWNPTGLRPLAAAEAAARGVRRPSHGHRALGPISSCSRSHGCTLMSWWWRWCCRWC